MIVGALITYVAAAVTSVTAAAAIATAATMTAGLTPAVVLLWAGVSMDIIALTVTVSRAVTAWRRAYWLGAHHAHSNAALARRVELARADQ